VFVEKTCQRGEGSSARALASRASDASARLSREISREIQQHDSTQHAARHQHAHTHRHTFKRAHTRSSTHVSRAAVLTLLVCWPQLCAAGHNGVLLATTVFCCSQRCRQQLCCSFMIRCSAAHLLSATPLSCSSQPLLGCSAALSSEPLLGCYAPLLRTSMRATRARRCTGDESGCWTPLRICCCCVHRLRGLRGLPGLTAAAAAALPLLLLPRCRCCCRCCCCCCCCFCCCNNYPSGTAGLTTDLTVEPQPPTQQHQAADSRQQTAADSRQQTAAAAECNHASHARLARTHTHTQIHALPPSHAHAHAPTHGLTCASACVPSSRSQLSPRLRERICELTSSADEMARAPLTPMPAEEHERTWRG
jgi:hypothetical protein